MKVIHFLTPAQQQRLWQLEAAILAQYNLLWSGGAGFLGIGDAYPAAFSSLSALTSYWSTAFGPNQANAYSILSIPSMTAALGVVFGAGVPGSLGSTPWNIGVLYLGVSQVQAAGSCFSALAPLTQGPEGPYFPPTGSFAPIIPAFSAQGQGAQYVAVRSNTSGPFVAVDDCCAFNLFAASPLLLPLTM